MADGSVFVYECARDAHAQITQLSDFISPTIVAMWNLRWQVQGFVAAHPDADQDTINSRFALGSNLKGNEIRRACLEITWEQQKSCFASMLLTNTISVFEDFVETLAGLTLSGEQKRKAYKDLQYPSDGSKGYPRAYAALGNQITELAGVFNDANVHGRWYSGPQLQNLLLCYRFFKEIRNAMSHNGGRATTDLVDAFQKFQPVATKASLGVREVPLHTAPRLNDPIDLDLRGVYGFSDVVLRIIATYDVDLSDRPAALGELNRRLGKIEGSARAHVDAAKYSRRIMGLLRQSHLPKAVLTVNFMEHLRSTGRIPNSW